MKAIVFPAVLSFLLRPSHVHGRELPLRHDARHCGELLLLHGQPALRLAFPQHSFWRLLMPAAWHVPLGLWLQQCDGHSHGQQPLPQLSCALTPLPVSWQRLHGPRGPYVRQQPVPQLQPVLWLVLLLRQSAFQSGHSAPHPSCVVQ